MSIPLPAPTAPHTRLRCMLRSGIVPLSLLQHPRSKLVALEHKAPTFIILVHSLKNPVFDPRVRPLSNVLLSIKALPCPNRETRIALPRLYSFPRSLSSLFWSFRHDSRPPGYLSTLNLLPMLSSLRHLSIHTSRSSPPQMPNPHVYG